MKKVKETPSTVLLKALVVYLTEEIQRPSNFKSMDYKEMLNYVEETEILLALNEEENKELKDKALAFSLKMALIRLGERLDVKGKDGVLSISKNSISIYDVIVDYIQINNVKELCFELLCRAGLVLNILKNLNLSDRAFEEEQTTFVV